MDNFLMILWFLVALGVLVTFHEFGHFFVARRCGVKVLRFSVGFGKPLYTWYDKQGTAYTVAAIPLGGFVKMVDEREGEVPEELLDQAFNRKNVWQRFAIVAAGPIANFILAVLVFWFLLLRGTTEVAPIIGSVDAGSIAAQAGLEGGQEILAIDGEPTPTWRQVNQQLLWRLGESGSMSFTVSYPDSELRYQSEVILEDWLKDVEEPDPVRGLGITMWYPGSTDIAYVKEGSPAAEAGLQVGDELISVDGRRLDDWWDWFDYFRSHPSIAIHIEVDRAGQLIPLEVVPETVTEETGFRYGRVGISTKPSEWPEAYLREYQYGFIEGLVAGVQRTWETSAFVLLSVKKLIVGEISTKNLSGPITIAKVAGASAKAGVGYYLGFLALLSVSLGVFNLLPIPVLDGGHLMFYLVEMVKGRPVSDRAQLIGQQIGLAVIIGIMLIALYNDLMRF